MVRLEAARWITHGESSAPVLLCRQPLSLWGGIDPETGRIIDHRHDRFGETVIGNILAIPSEKGSSTGSAVLLELLRTGKAPAAIITCHPSPILALGAIIASELYDIRIPVLQLGEADFGTLQDGEALRIDADGAVFALDR
ncbi:aconitase X swivel domain-containing protein [Candidatus Bipolaricaulota bacterium]